MKKKVCSLLLSVSMAVAIMTQAAFAWSADQNTLYTSFGKANDISTTQLQYMETIYNYLTDELELNSAAACGLLANMYRETRFDPVADNTSSFIGIVQWARKYVNIDPWCSNNGYSSNTLEGQLAYLGHQFRDYDPFFDAYDTNLYHSVYQYLLGVENTAQGAYDAAYYFCYYFERPANKANTSVSRGNLAQTVFFPFYQSLGLTNGGEDARFVDVSSSDWYFDAVNYAYDNSLVSGTSSTTFTPSGTLTRAEAVQILYNLSGNSRVSVSTPFQDVSSDAWYQAAVNWAWSTGCVSGTSDITFSPDDLITREQLVQLLYNYYTNYLSYDAENPGSLYSFADAGNLTFGTDAMQWAVGNGIVSGTPTSDGLVWLHPQNSCTRAEGCTLFVQLHRLMG